jgi:hypothetical protein
MRASPIVPSLALELIADDIQFLTPKPASMSAAA